MTSPGLNELLYNAGTPILSSPNHSHCRWYKSRSWALRKRASAILPQQSGGSQRYTNLALHSYQKSDIPCNKRGGTTILNIPFHSYCRWYTLRPWALIKRPKVISYVPVTPNLFVNAPLDIGGFPGEKPDNTESVPMLLSQHGRQ